MKLRKTLSQDGSQKRNRKILEYEANNDIRVLQNSTYRTACTYVGFCSEDIDEYNILKNNPDNSHIVYSDRKKPIPDMHAIKGTQEISQIQSIRGSNPENNWSFITSYRPCSCPSCLSTFSNNNCEYYDERTIEVQKVNDKQYDPQEMGKLTVKVLPQELLERGLSDKGRKPELVLRMMTFLEETANE